MTLVRCQTSFQGFSGMAEDRFVNTLYVDANAIETDPGFDLPGNLELTNGDAGLDGSVGIGASLQTIISNFYTANHGAGGTSVGFFMAGNSMAGGNEATFKCYRMADPEKRVPFHTGTFNAMGTNTANDPIPAEVACCLSFSATKASGGVAARRRGRIFIGPLGKNVLNVPALGSLWQSRPSAEFQATLLAAGVALGNALRTAGHRWVVHSPTTGPLARFDVATVSVDDAFDTIRSRGPGPSARLTAALTA